MNKKEFNLDEYDYENPEINMYLFANILKEMREKGEEFIMNEKGRIEITADKEKIAAHKERAKKTEFVIMTAETRKKYKKILDEKGGTK